MHKISIGLLGCGTIGTGVVRVLLEKHDWLLKTTNLDLEFTRICEIDKKRWKAFNIPQSKFTTNAYDVINDPAIDIVIELIGGTTIALEFILAALKNKKHVVTANKALLAEHGQRVMSSAVRNQVQIAFEASVGGGIPIIHAMKVGLTANRIQSILGILNGTTNYILTRMTQEGADYSEILKDAQKQGYAEANPTLDVSGSDAAHKIAILSFLATRSWVNIKNIYTEGITGITAQDIQYAAELGYIIKLLAIAKNTDNGLDVRVHPVMLPKDNLLASVNGIYNGIMVTGDVVGTTMFYGRGAGMMPTASAVISDLIVLGKQIVNKEKSTQPEAIEYGYMPVKSISQIISQYYLRFSVIDKPGGLATLAGILGRHQISIASVIQKIRKAGDAVPVIIMTHEAKEESLQKAIKEIDRLHVIRGKSFIIRVES